ncbi:ABC transporter substrate-binding protein [Deinococcus roseus]|uniref:ABC transporter substrate-binding protein n=1 Tax=Deinococcus roseus TaxID=392414 RepID=A0ABQ2D306_9DEIO|nr:extracellular solute-binding protein [Deinococcus roseus]GGJ38860.1 ABC transporter substrate-binding protein [Deinococcus roseus]
MKRILGLFVVLALGNAAQAATLTVNCFSNMNVSVEAAIPLWKKLHPDVDIKVNTLAYGDHHNALTTALATGSGAGDVDCVEVGFVAKFGESGGLEDLLKAPYNAKQYQSKVTAYAWAQSTNPDGGLYVFPADIAPGTLFYREDVLKKAGVSAASLTKSWESYIAAGKKIKEKTGAYLLHNAGFVAQAYIRAKVPAGESLFFDTKGQPVLNSARFVQAITLAKQVRDARLDANIAEWSPEWTDGLNKGRIATQPFGAWFEGTMRSMIPETAGKWRSVDLPEKSYATWGGSFMAIPKQSKQKELAWEFLKFFALNKEVQLNSFRVNSSLPSLKAAQSDALFKQPVEFLGGQVARPMWVRAANKVKGIESNRLESVATDAFAAALDRVLNNNVAIKTALDEAQSTVARRLNR